MPSILFFLRMNHKATRPAAPTTNIPITMAGSGVEFPAMSSPRIERLYIRLTKNEKERLRQFTGKVGMPLQIPIEVKPETSLGRNKF